MSRHPSIIGVAYLFAIVVLYLIFDFLAASSSVHGTYAWLSVWWACLYISSVVPIRWTSSPVIFIGGSVIYFLLGTYWFSQAGLIDHPFSSYAEFHAVFLPVYGLLYCSPVLINEAVRAARQWLVERMT